MADKLSPAQQRVLDIVALRGHVFGVAVVPKHDGVEDNVVSLSTARSLVKLGYLTEGADRVFEVAEQDEDDQAAEAARDAELAAAQAEHESAFARLMAKLRSPRAVEENNSRGMIRVFTAIEQARPGAVYQGTVPAAVVARRRKKNKAARASRRVNR